MLENKGNLLTPLRRDKKKDFAHGYGDDLLKSKIIQALATEGELPWRTDLKSGLSRLKHQQNNDVLAELARVYVNDALRNWVPEVEVLKVITERRDSSLYLRISYRQRAGGKEDVARMEIET